MSEHRIELVTLQGQRIPAIFRLTRNGYQCGLILDYAAGHLEVTGKNDYFDALCCIREQLEPQGLRPWCYGASRNVFPSGMARDMGEGLVAYRLTSGRSASRDDLVDIFDAGEDVEPVTVKEQEIFLGRGLGTTCSRALIAWQHECSSN